MLELFTSRGDLRRDFSADELATLTPEKRAAFDTLSSAATALEESERGLKAAEAEVHLRVRDLHATQRLVNESMPARTFHDEWKASVAAHNKAERGL